MKCVGLLLCVLLVQSVDKFMKGKYGKWNDVSPDVSIPDQHISDNIEQADKNVNHDDFRSKLNTTQGILIPGNLLLTLPLSEISSDVVRSFHSLQQTLSDLSGCKSKMVSSVATDLFALLDKIANKIGSLNEERSSLSDAIPGVFQSIKDVISSLDIGTSINDAVSNIETNLQNVLQVLDEAKNSGSNITKIFNDAVFSMAVSVQVVIVTIAVIAEKAGATIATITIEAKEAVISLTLILQTIIVFVQSIGSSIGSIALSLPDRITPTSSVLNSLLWIVDRGLPSITNALSSISSSSVTSSMSLVVSTISVTLTSFTYRLNQSMEKLQTSIVLETSKKLETILYNVIGSEADFAKYITTSAATVTSSISAISSSDSGLQSQISRQLYTVFQSLSKLTGSDSEVAATFASLLPNIFDVLKQTASSLVYGIGLELTKSIINSIEDIFIELLKMANLLIQDTVDATEMDKITVDCAKAVQVFGSAVVAIWSTISSSISSVNSAALETVIALPIFHSAILYVVEWMTVVASSVLLTKTGQNHELVSSLAVTIVIILKHVSGIVELIATSSFNHQNLYQIVSLVKSPVSDLTKVGTPISEISKVNAKTSVKIEQMASGESDVSAVEGIDNAAEGNLSEILYGLTGSLSTISSSFSSSLSSLKNSLNRIASSEFDLLQSFSGAFNSITTNLSNISGPAVQILQLTSNSLHSIFGRLLETASRLTNLGDVVSVLISSIADISTALHSLIYAVKDYKSTACYLTNSSREIAKTVQILISTLDAIIHSAANTTSDILDKLGVEIATLPYLVSTVILVVQQVLGAAIPSLSEVAGIIHATQHELTQTMARILESLTSITTEVTACLTDGSVKEIASKISNSVTNLQDYTSASLSKLSGVLANIQVTLGLAPAS